MSPRLEAMVAMDLRMSRVDATAPPWTLWAGAAAALLLAAGYLATIPLFAAVGAPPVGAAARLEYHATTTTAWSAIIALSVLTDLLYVPVAIALSTVLRRTSRPAMLVATAFMALFVVLDLAVTWPAYASLVALGGQYAVASGEERALLVAAAGYPSAVLGSPLQAFDSILTLSIGILATGLVMARDGFGRAAALTGIATGSIGIASVVETALSGAVIALAIAASILTIAWLVLVGLGLLRAARAPAVGARRS
jgi:hypothetical protein